MPRKGSTSGTELPGIERVIRYWVEIRELQTGLVRTWTPAEDLTPVERMEGSRLIGRHRRLSPWDCWAGRMRTLADVADPFVRASALWLAHSLMAATHIDAPDRRTGLRPQDRQGARLAGAAAVSLGWLADRMRGWPRHYRRHR
jgi:hypothetical protein